MGPNGALVERTYDNVITSRSVKGKIKDMFESRPHKPIACQVERDREVQEVRDMRTAKALPVFSGGRKPGRSKAEGGVEEEEKKEESSMRREQKKAAEQKECLSQIPVQACSRAAYSWDCSQEQKQ